MPRTSSANHLRLAVPVLIAMAASGCPSPPPVDRPPPKPTVVPAPKPPAPFENPGGMWMPSQLADQAQALKDLGLALDPAALADPMRPPLAAVVSLGGCSASFVSPDGLIITNHHCATGVLQFNSTKEQNLLELGYLAKTQKEEKSAGPRQRVFVTQSFRDVTPIVRAGLEEQPDDVSRFKLVEKREKELVAACEKDRPHLRCSVVSYYGGAQYIVIEQLEIRDVRLVYAPAEGVGNFGGEIDNWRWPRHGGDYSFYRAYVGPDGKPADFAEANVPFKPAHYLKIAATPLGPGDMVLAAGYPGQTSRLKTAAEVASAVDWYYPRRQQLCEEYIPLLETLAKEDPKLDIAGRSLLRGLANSLTNTKGMIDGLTKGGLKAQKERAEAELLRWIGEHPEHRGAEAAVAALAALQKKQELTRDADAATWEMLSMSALLGSSELIVHMAEERPKPDAERHPDFQERNHKRMEQSQEQLQKTFDERLDKAKLRLALLRAARLPEDRRPKALTLIVGDDASEAGIDKALARLYAGTQLTDVKRRLALLQKATTAELQKSKDTFLQLGVKLRPIVQEMEDRDDAFAGATLMARPRYVAALRASKGGVLAPDANGTLRVTFGTVRGYRPKPEAEIYYPFTTLSQMVAKNTGAEPFNAPAKLIEAAKAGPFGPYLHAELKEVPVDFLADLDITGGNSGSPTLNAKGELVGLVFDGNYESMASDWVFIPAITRSIHVDIRYVLWLMDRVDGADHLLVEMGVKPAIE